jgi:hypothetical protein
VSEVKGKNTYMNMLAEFLIWHLLGVFLSSGFCSVLVESFLDSLFVDLDSTLLRTRTQCQGQECMSNATHDNYALGQLLVKITHSSLMENHLLFDVKNIFHNKVELC